MCIRDRADVAFNPKVASALEKNFVVDDFLLGHGVSPYEKVSETREIPENGEVTNLERDAALGAVAGKGPVAPLLCLEGEVIHVSRSFLAKR